MLYYMLQLALRLNRSLCPHTRTECEGDPIHPDGKGGSYLIEHCTKCGKTLVTPCTTDEDWGLSPA